MRSRPIRVLAATAAATTTFTLLASADLTAEAATQTASCVDEGGQKWTSKVVWGDPYTDAEGVRKVAVDYAGWTTDAGNLPTDSEVRSYDGNGSQWQEVLWTGSFDYQNGNNWRSINPRNAPTDPGDTKLTITLGIDGDGKGNCSTTFLQPGSTTSETAPESTSSSTSTSSTSSASGWWSSSQSSVPLGDAGCSSGSSTATATALAKEWDYWDNCGGAEVSASSEGLSSPPGGVDRVFRWRKPAGSNQVYQKLNRTFTKDNWPAGSAGPGVPNSGSPADASGVYSVYQYIPSGRFRLGSGWVILSEFKENYNDSSGSWRQDPTWGLGCNMQSGSARCGLMPHSGTTFALSNYMDRWVKWEYRVYQGDKDRTGHGGRIELYADGRLLETGYESERHVGSAAFSPLSRTRSWVWIAGQYTSNQSSHYQNTDVTSYLGRSSVTPLP